MKHISIAIFTLCVFGITTSAFAESLPETCKKKEQEIQGMTAKVATFEKEMATLKEKLDALKKQEEELIQQQKAKDKQKKNLLNKIKKEEKKNKKMCAVLAKCADYEAKIADIKTRVAPISAELKAIRNEMKESQKKSEDLSKAVDAIEVEYQKLNCANLVAGQTDQPTINTCHDLFSKWNSMQIDIDKLNAKIAELQKKYNSTMKRLLPATLVLIKLHKEMHGTCGFSKRLAELDTMKKEQEGYSSMKGDLENMKQRVHKIKIMKFRKPKLERKTGPDAKPAPQPKKQGKEAKGGFNINLKAKGNLNAKAKMKPMTKIKAKAKLKAKAKATVKAGAKKE